MLYMVPQRYKYHSCRAVVQAVMHIILQMSLCRQQAHNCSTVAQTVMQIMQVSRHWQEKEAKENKAAKKLLCRQQNTTPSLLCTSPGEIKLQADLLV